MQQVAEISLITAVGEKSLYHYAVPSRLTGTLREGMLVHVPFTSRELHGVVFDPHVLSPVERELREIQAVLDPSPVITKAGIALARWLSEQYACPVSEALSAMLPLGLSGRTTYHITRVSDASTGQLTAAQERLLRLIPETGTVTLKGLSREGGAGTGKTIASLVKCGIVVRNATLSRAGAKTVRLVEWTGTRPERAPGPKGRAVLAILEKADGPILLTELRRHVDGADNALRPLQRQGLIRFTEEAARRDPIAHRLPTSSNPLPLTAEQREALAAISAALNGARGGVFLLHGVTGSGKTEVYMQALAIAIGLGRQGIMLVPEISLTPQTMDRFAARFPGRIALLHSGLSEGERIDEWERIRSGDADAVVGARSAIFSPFPHPGLIVLDEEHDSSYKQDRAPRYHTRDVALRLAEETGAVVILGSATPDVTSYHEAARGAYTLLRMNERAVTVGASADGSSRAGSPAALPPVEIVDLRQELHAGNRSIFSRALQTAMREALTRREQIILFLNRRGSATFVLCRDCGFVARCLSCDLPYTYHRSTEDLVCHRCDDHAVVPTLCGRCGSWRIRYFGLGTQRVEDEAQELFPDARLLRWDRDIIGGRHGHEHVLDHFSHGHADILVGTQMVAKGLDIPRVTVVGVISADTALNLPDFRSAERTFQLLTQVAGRAGRHSLPGRVVIQTYTPDHFAIQAAAEHDYQAFYDQEIRFRAEAAYPPFLRLLRLVYSDQDERVCRAEGERLATRLRAALGLVRHGDVIGPAPCFIGKVEGRYLWQVLVRADDVHPLLSLVPSSWIRDVDPMSLL